MPFAEVRRFIPQPVNTVASTFGQASPSNPLYMGHNVIGHLAPEHSIDSLRMAVQMGLPVVEFDFYLLPGGGIVLTHDTNVNTTTDHSGSPDAFSLSQWQESIKLQPVTYFGGLVYPNGLTPATIVDAFSILGGAAVLSGDAKNTGGTAAFVDMVVRRGLQQQAVAHCSNLADCQYALSKGVAPLFISNSTDPTPLSTYYNAGVRYVTMLGGESDSWAAQLVAAGLKVFHEDTCRQNRRDHYLGLGFSGFQSSDPIYLQGSVASASYRRTSDPFSFQTFYHGHIAGQSVEGAETLPLYRGQFYSSSNGWGISQSLSSNGYWVLQGWGCPLASATHTFTLNVKVEVAGTDTSAQAGVAFECADDSLVNWNGATSTNNCYIATIRETGQLVLRRIDNGTSTVLGTQNTAAVGAGSFATLQIAVTPTTVTLTRTDVGAPNSVTANDATYRGRYFHLGQTGSSTGAYFSFNTVGIS